MDMLSYMFFIFETFFFRYILKKFSLFPVHIFRANLWLWSFSKPFFLTFVLVCFFSDLGRYIEGLCAQELRKLKPVGGNKKNQRGGGGRGARGRGRGGGGGPPKVDPEKEMQFKVIQRQLAFTLEK